MLFSMLAAAAAVLGGDEAVKFDSYHDARVLSAADELTLPLADRQFVRYVYLPPDPIDVIDVGGGQPVLGVVAEYEAALFFVIASTSRAVLLEQQLPVRIHPPADGTSASTFHRLYRIDLRGLEWTVAGWKVLGKTHPYLDYGNPRTVRGDWMILELTDYVNSDAYYSLLLGSQPKDRDDFLARLRVEKDKVRQLGLDFGLAEANSRVSLQKIRLLEFFDVLGGYAAGTKDFFEVTADNSPLENIDPNDVKHDAEEWIVGMTKSWSGPTPGRGALQAYLLSNGQGVVQREAPARIVEDTTRFAGQPVIRTSGSCIQCHTLGLNQPSVNGLRKLLENGVELKTYSGDLAGKLERFHLTDTGQFISRANEDYAAAVMACNGMTATQNAQNFQYVVETYLQPVTLELAAAEINATKEEFVLAVALASERGNKVGAHLAQLVHGQPIPRTIWESVYLRAVQYVVERQAK